MFTASLLVHGDHFDPIKMYSRKDRVEKSVNHIEDKVKQLYATYLGEQMAELTDVFKKAAKYRKV